LNQITPDGEILFEDGLRIFSNDYYLRNIIYDGNITLIFNDYFDYYVKCITAVGISVWEGFNQIVAGPGHSFIYSKKVGDDILHLYSNLTGGLFLHSSNELGEPFQGRLFGTQIENKSEGSRIFLDEINENTGLIVYSKGYAGCSRTYFISTGLVAVMKEIDTLTENDGKSNGKDAEFVLQNFPNPFNPTTTIKFNLPNNVNNPELQVFNIKGQIIKSLSLESNPQNNGSVVWNGKDNHEQTVSSGIYFYKIRANNYVGKIKKMILLK